MPEDRERGGPGEGSRKREGLEHPSTESGGPFLWARAEGRSPGLQLSSSEQLCEQVRMPLPKLVSVVPGPNQGQSKLRGHCSGIRPKWWVRPSPVSKGAAPAGPGQAARTGSPSLGCSVVSWGWLVSGVAVWEAGVGRLSPGAGD